LQTADQCVIVESIVVIVVAAELSALYRACLVGTGGAQVRSLVAAEEPVPLVVFQATLGAQQRATHAVAQGSGVAVGLGRASQSVAKCPTCPIALGPLVDEHDYWPALAAWRIADQRDRAGRFITG